MFAEDCGQWMIRFDNFGDFLRSEKIDNDIAIEFKATKIEVLIDPSLGV